MIPLICAPGGRCPRGGRRASSVASAPLRGLSCPANPVGVAAFRFNQVNVFELFIKENTT